METKDWGQTFYGQFIGNEKLCCNGDYCKGNCAAEQGEEIMEFISQTLQAERLALLARLEQKLATSFKQKGDTKNTSADPRDAFHAGRRRGRNDMLRDIGTILIAERNALTHNQQ